MNRSSTFLSTLFIRHRHMLGLALGLGLGQAVSQMAQRDDASTLGFGISTVFVAAATASYVFFVLGQQRTPAPAALLWKQARPLLGVIGLGLLLSLRAYELLG